MADAFVLVVHNGMVGETYNIGTNTERSVQQVAADVCAQFKIDPKTSIEYVSDRLFNDRRCA